MRGRVVVVGGAWVALLFALSPACGSTGTGNGNDAGTDALGDRMPGDAITDGMADTADAKPPECMGIDADSVGIDFAPGCLTCVATYCCTEAKACATSAECKQIIKCEAACSAMGNAAMTCAEACIYSDGKDAGGSTEPPDGFKASSAESQAETLDFCFAPHCASVCGS